MSIRTLVHALAALCTALLALGCSTSPPTGQQLEQRCQSWRNYARTKPADYVIEECSHQMGEAACRKCLEP